MRRSPVLVAALPLLLAGAAFAAADRSEGAVTFSKDVAPILQENCQTCHRPGDIAPMSLMTFKEARPWAKSIRQVVSDRTMPPWHADAPAGTFHNERILSEGERKTLASWATAGAPKGDDRDMPPAPKLAVRSLSPSKPSATITCASKPVFQISSTSPGSGTQARSAGGTRSNGQAPPQRRAMFSPAFQGPFTPSSFRLTHGSRMPSRL